MTRDSMSSGWIYDFADGNRSMADLLGGKGANLAEMTGLGLPVPPGFTITTDACRHFLDAGELPADFDEQLDAAVGRLEVLRGKQFGDLADPLLVSVRSGARFSMPGMMDTVLNVGLSDAGVEGLARVSGSERFAWDSYRRLVAMFGKTVLGVPGEAFEAALDAAKKARGVTLDTQLDAGDLRALTKTFQDLVLAHTGDPFPQDARTQVGLAVEAVFRSWNGDRARIYRRQERIPDDLGTAVSVVAMVFGNLGDDSGTGVAFTRDPGSGEVGVYGDYLSNAQGEDVVAGIRNTLPLTALEELDPTSYRDLLGVMATLEGHYRDLCDIEFTIERGKLWMLQTRVGKRTAAAAFVIAAQLVEEKVIDLDEALLRVTGEQLAQLMFPRFPDGTDESEAHRLLATGMNASPGAAVGKAVFSSATAVEWAGRGDAVILVRRETNPDDLAGMIAAQGVLTSRGGKTSHAAVVARGMGKTCVCGAEQLEVDVEAGKFTNTEGIIVSEGDVISVDGTSGRIWEGEMPVVVSPVAAFLEEGGGAAGEDPVVKAVALFLGHADVTRRLGIRANADTPDDAARARRMGAAGIGLCRTEHMFLGERRELVQRLILAKDETEQNQALEALVPLQRSDFAGLLDAMDGLPVTVRLLDPPLHEFLPDLTSLSVEVALAEERRTVDPVRVELLAAVHRLHEENPMIGLRGVRLGLTIPALFAVQVRALAEATADRLAAGGDPRPEIMVPLVATVRELEIVRDQTLAVLAAVGVERGVDLSRVLIGTMIETPRAAVTAGTIAPAAQFFSFGTNDLTQMTWGFSRDDVEASFFSTYLEFGIFETSPFESLDVAGVGALLKTAVEAGRSARPDIHLGVCGEHAGDPRSIHFLHDAGVDYLSCSPFRAPVARLEAGRAAVEKVSGA